MTSQRLASAAAVLVVVAALAVGWAFARGHTGTSVASAAESPRVAATQLGHAYNQALSCYGTSPIPQCMVELRTAVQAIAFPAVAHEDVNDLIDDTNSPTINEEFLNLVDDVRLITSKLGVNWDQELYARA